MNSTIVLDTPINILITKTVSAFNIISVNVILNNQANIIVMLLDPSGNLLGYRTFLLKESDYENWGNDDNYIINYITNKIQNITSLYDTN